MIALFDGSGDKLPVAYRGLTVNDPNDDPKDTYELWAALVDAEHAAVAEPKMQWDGSEIYRPRKQRRIIRLAGAVKAPSPGELFDKIEALHEAFDPVNAFLADESEADVGFLPLTFSRPTADTDNYASGLKELQYFARSLSMPVSRVSKNDGQAARFSVLMECADPRAYARTASSAQVVGGGNTPLDNSLATYSSWPTLTLTMTGASGAAIGFGRTWTGGTKELTLDLSGVVNGDVIVVDMERRTIEKNGVSAMDLYVSGDYWWVPWGESATFAVAEDTGTFNGTADLAWFKAFA